MNVFTSKRLTDLAEYIPEDTSYPVRLDANESFIGLSAALRAQIADAVAGLAFNRYPDPMATEVCALFADYLGVCPETVTAGNGSDELIGLLIGSILEKGDKVLIAAPDFAMYRFYAALAAAPLAVVGKDAPDFRLSAEQILRRAQEERPAMVLFSNPCSPTGQVMPREEIRTLLEALPCTLVVDEAYGDFCNQSVAHWTAQYSNLVVLKTASKALGLAALRLGFAITAKENTQVLRKAKSIYNVNAVTQAIAAVVLRDKAFLRQAAADIRKSRDALYAGLCKTEGLTVLPSAANFLFVKPKGDAAALHTALRQAGICVRHMGDYLRITCGSPEDNTALLERMWTLCGKKV